MKRMVQRTVATLLAVLLVVSLVPPRIHADAGAGMKQATRLEAGKAVTFTTGVEPVNTYWFKLERNGPSDMTHMQIVMEATKLAHISVYPSADMGAKDETFYPYRASASKEDGKATINLPYAWEGPYYVKVEYMPMEMPDMYPPEESFSLEEGEESEEPSGEPDMSEFASEIELVYNPVKLPVKYEQQGGDMCAVETIFMSANDQKTMLELIRRVQTGVLNQSEQGRELAALYYRASPYIVKAITFDKAKRQAAYQDLMTLKPLLTALVDRKQHTVSSKEATAINRMHGLVNQSVPEGLKADIASVAGLAGMDELAGTPITDVFDRIGITVNVSDAPRYIVKYKSSPSQSIGKMNALRDVSAERLSIGASGDHFALVDVEAASAKTQASAQTMLNNDPNVEYIEPIEKYSAFMVDPTYSYQWSVNSRSILKPFADAGIGLDKYEALKLNARSVKVAVLDTGVDHRLLDLKGKVDVKNGKNFVDPNGEGDAIDDHGHGTHVAGVIAAAQNNGTSMRGMMPNVSILPVKVLDSWGYGETDQIALGIKYAVDAGAKVINMSLGGSESRTIGYMLKYAHDRGVIIVAATGNDGQSLVSYPASSKYTISVGATNTFGLVSDYSNFGINVDVVAPGSKVASLVPDGNVVYMDGTSMATPHVAAAVALLVSQHPRMTVEGVRSILRRSAEPLAFTGGDAPRDPRMYDGMQQVLDELKVPLLPYYDVVSGYGKVNVYRAESMLQIAPKPGRVFDNAPVFTVAAKPGTVVNVYNGTKRIGWGTARNGSVTMSLTPQKPGTVLRVTYTNGSLFTGERVTVAKGLRPNAPSVTAPRANAKQVTGKAQAGMTVVVRDAQNRVIGKSKVTLAGTYTAKTRALKKGERLSVHVEDVTKKVSKITTVIVK